MRSLVSVLVFLALFATPARAVTFNCGTVIMIQAGLVQPAHSNVPEETLSFEASLAIALRAMEKASPQSATTFQFLAFNILEGMEIVTTHDGTFEKPYRFVFPNRRPYAAAPRARVWRAPLLVWPASQRNPTEAALAAVRLVYEAAALKKLPPNTVRVWRQINGSREAFIDNAVASLNSQYLVYLGFKQMNAVPALRTRLSFWSRWTALFRGRATRNPFYRGLELTQDLVVELDAVLFSSAGTTQILSSLRSHVETHYRRLLNLDAGLNATFTASALAAATYGGMLVADFPIADSIPDRVEMSVEIFYDGQAEAEQP